MVRDLPSSIVTSLNHSTGEEEIIEPSLEVWSIDYDYNQLLRSSDFEVSQIGGSLIFSIKPQKSKEAFEATPAQLTELRSALSSFFAGHLLPAAPETFDRPVLNEKRVSLFLSKLSVIPPVASSHIFTEFLRVGKPIKPTLSSHARRLIGLIWPRKRSVDPSPPPGDAELERLERLCCDLRTKGAAAVDVLRRAGPTRQPNTLDPRSILTSAVSEAAIAIEVARERLANAAGEAETSLLGLEDLASDLRAARADLRAAFDEARQGSSGPGSGGRSDRLVAERNVLIDETTKLGVHAEKTMKGLAKQTLDRLSL